MTKQVLVVGQTKDKALLTKSQKEFNRLTKRIAQLQADIQGFEEATGRLQRRVAADLEPLMREYAQLRADIVRLMDKSYESGKYKSQEMKKLKHIIGTMAYELIAQGGMEDLKPIYDKYSDTNFDDEDAEAEEATATLMRNMMEQMFGIEIEEGADVSTPEKMQAYLDERMGREEAVQAERQRMAEEHRAQRPKTAKQIEREQKKAEKEKKQAEEKAKVTKSVREVYLDLVKAFHPDREPEEEERQRKTEIMQRVTAAYEGNDLLALLHLQLEFERIDQDHLENIAEDRLKHFNKILRTQAAELDETLYILIASIARVTNQSPYQINSPQQLEYWLERDVKNLKKQLREIEQDLRDLTDPVAMKAWLKSYKIRKPKEEDVFGDLFG